MDTKQSVLLILGLSSLLLLIIVFIYYRRPVLSPVVVDSTPKTLPEPEKSEALPFMYRPYVSYVRQPPTTLSAPSIDPSQYALKEGVYLIKNNDASLSVYGPTVFMESRVSIPWRISPVPGKPDHYWIQNMYQCPGNRWCLRPLGWVYTETQPMASIEFDPIVEWKIVPVQGNRYHIFNTSECSENNFYNQWCMAGLSFADARIYNLESSYVILDTTNFAEWEIIPAPQDTYNKEFYNKIYSV